MGLAKARVTVVEYLIYLNALAGIASCTSYYCDGQGGSLGSKWEP